MAYQRLKPPFLVLALVATTLATACDRDDQAPDPEPEPAQQAGPPHHDHREIAEPLTLDLSAATDLVELDVGEPQVFSDCRRIFERHGEPLDWPLDDDEVAATIFGCNPGGYLEFPDGRRALAYDVPVDDDHRVRHLRVVLYDADGQIAWHQLMNRGRHRDAFTASYRGTFLTALGDQLLCAGTRWHETTQMLCARQETGRVVYNDHMSLWAGLPFFTVGDGLYSADVTGITRRYPFTGVEMQHRSFGERVGRAGFYATDKARVFVVPSQEKPQLSAWDVASFSRAWTADLPGTPVSSYAHADAGLDLLLLIIDDRLIGFEASTGAHRFTYYVGDERPPVAFADDELLLLIRRDNGPFLMALDPNDGSFRWSGPAPAGTLALDHDGQHYLTRTVRTVRTVRPAR